MQPTTPQASPSVARGANARYGEIARVVRQPRRRVSPRGTTLLSRSMRTAKYHEWTRPKRPGTRKPIQAIDSDRADQQRVNPEGRELSGPFVLRVLERDG